MGGAYFGGTGHTERGSVGQVDLCALLYATELSGDLPGVPVGITPRTAASG